MWKLKLPPKVRIFLWRVSHNLLPTSSKIAALNPLTSSLCPKCGEADETLTYALCDCPKARNVLVHGGIDGRILSSGWTTGVDWIESMMRLLDKPAFECFVMVFWNIWNARNNMVFKGSMDEPRVVWDRDFRIYNLYQPALIPKQTQQLKWSKPLSGSLKINFDAAWIDNKAGMGFITRDEEGFVHGEGVF